MNLYLDAAELAELLGFVAAWLNGADRQQLNLSLQRFIGCPGYELADLHADLVKFAFLLGGNDGEPLSGAST